MDAISSAAKKSVLVTTRLDEETHAAIVRRARLADRTVTAEIRRAVRFYLEREDENGADAA